MRRIAVLAVPVLVFVACGGGGGPTTAPTSAPTTGPTAAPTTVPSSTAGATTGPTQAGGLPSEEQLCGLLTADDWGQFGYVTAAQPETDSDGPGTAYCVYAGDSGATGGLEFDAFVDASPDDAHATFETMAEGMGDALDIPLEGADEAIINPSIDGEFGAIVVRAGRFSFTISLPAGEQAEVQLGTLAAAVLTRAAAYR